MLAADSDLQVRPSLASALSRHFYQLSDALAVEHRKRVLLQNAFRQIRRQHLINVITREAERSLRQIVGPERKELRLFRDLIRNQRSPRQFDHGADHVLDLL